jgi:tripartite-type tricarboxylate transporter receptor subunit TctC
MGHLKGGKVRVLASWGDTRHPALPDVPTLKELGYDAQFSQWTGLFVPAGTPEPVVAKLREAAKAAAADPTFLAALARVETPPQYLDQPQFRAFWDADAKKLAEVVKRIGRVE